MHSHRLTLDHGLGDHRVVGHAPHQFDALLEGDTEARRSRFRELAGLATDQAQLNALKGEYGNMFDKGIVDAAKVTRSALQHAASIAGMVLTTEVVINDKPEPEGAGGMPPGAMGGGMPGMM